MLIHWGRGTHICVSKLTINGSDKALSPDRRQAIMWTNNGKVLIWPLGTNFRSKTLSEMHISSLKKIHLNMSSAKCRPFCLSFNVLNMISGWISYIVTASCACFIIKPVCRDPCNEEILCNVCSWLTFFDSTYLPHRRFNWHFLFTSIVRCRSRQMLHKTITNANNKNQVCEKNV